MPAPPLLRVGVHWFRCPIRVDTEGIMNRRAPALALALATMLFSILPVAAAAGAETAIPLPASMAAVGDSITQAASSAGSLGADAPQNSWSTGTSSTVNSHHLRLLSLGAQISGTTYNRSVSGAKVAGLAAQMQDAATYAPDYLTVLIGGNDLCTDTVDQMTSVADFGAQFEGAMATLEAASPDTNVYVVSIPDAYQLWSLFKGDFWARFIWSSADICQSLLANPTSTQQSDVQRRATVKERNIAYNAQLASVCAAHARCRFDGNATFNTKLTTGDVSGDYFHPSVQGQAKLASVSWTAGYSWITTPPPGEAMHVADLSGTASSVNRKTWRATVTIAVVDAAGRAVSGATVGGSFAPGSSKSCTTGTVGTCLVTSDNLARSSVGSVTFSVANVTHASLAYDASANTESQIMISRP